MDMFPANVMRMRSFDNDKRFGNLVLEKVYKGIMKASEQGGYQYTESIAIPNAFQNKHRLCDHVSVRIDHAVKELKALGYTVKVDRPKPLAEGIPYLSCYHATFKVTW
ncbi:hypothetical protein DRO66_00505 [Candidatus Bathyarchaeota archaeon]|nr:MAG: hypothetical protein DRO66_00505 [Candidatus Bathyarchaeota archaeon]